jgi:hypothetical protein
MAGSEAVSKHLSQFLNNRPVLESLLYHEEVSLRTY